MRFALALLVSLLGACVAPANDAMLDPALRQHLATVDDDTPVDVLVGIGEADAAAAQRDLEGAGLEVRTVAGGVAVGRGVRAAIRRAAALPWVERVALSQTRPPLPERPGAPLPLP